MRILIRFQQERKYPYQQNQLTGLVYRLIAESGFINLHHLPQDKPRLFNFSQLYLSQKGLCLLISSPINDLVMSIKGYLETKPILTLANNQLDIEEIRVLRQRIKFPAIVKTETPLVLRVDKNKFSFYGINLKKPYPYFFWRPLKGLNIPFEPFIRQLEAGVYKKYKLFSGQEVEEQPIFTKFMYKKTIDLPYFKNKQKISRPGTLWEFEINPAIDKKMVEFIMDTGLGELNSQGYGFVNLK